MDFLSKKLEQVLFEAKDLNFESAIQYISFIEVDILTEIFRANINEQLLQRRFEPEVKYSDEESIEIIIKCLNQKVYNKSPRSYESSNDCQNSPRCNDDIPITTKCKILKKQSVGVKRKLNTCQTSPMIIFQKRKRIKPRLTPFYKYNYDSIHRYDCNEVKRSRNDRILTSNMHLCVSQRLLQTTYLTLLQMYLQYIKFISLKAIDRPIIKDIHCMMKFFRVQSFIQTIAKTNCKDSSSPPCDDQVLQNMAQKFLEIHSTIASEEDVCNFFQVMLEHLLFTPKVSEFHRYDILKHFTRMQLALIDNFIYIGMKYMGDWKCRDQERVTALCIECTRRCIHFLKIYLREIWINSCKQLFIYDWDVRDQIYNDIFTTYKQCLFLWTWLRKDLSKVCIYLHCPTFNYPSTISCTVYVALVSDLVKHFKELKSISDIERSREEYAKYYQGISFENPSHPWENLSVTSMNLNHVNYHIILIRQFIDLLLTCKRNTDIQQVRISAKNIIASIQERHSLSKQNLLQDVISIHTLWILIQTFLSERQNKYAQALLENLALVLDHHNSEIIRWISTPSSTQVDYILSLLHIQNGQITEAINKLKTIEAKLRTSPILTCQSDYISRSIYNNESKLFVLSWDISSRINLQEINLQDIVQLQCEMLLFTQQHRNLLKLSLTQLKYQWNPLYFLFAAHATIQLISENRRKCSLNIAYSSMQNGDSQRLTLHHDDIAQINQWIFSDAYQSFTRDLQYYILQIRGALAFFEEDNQDLAHTFWYEAKKLFPGSIANLFNLCILYLQSDKAEYAAILWLTRRDFDTDMDLKNIDSNIAKHLVHQNNELRMEPRIFDFEILPSELKRFDFEMLQQLKILRLESASSDCVDNS